MKRKSILIALMLVLSMGLFTGAEAGGAYISIGVPAVVGVYPSYYSPCYSACGSYSYEYYGPAYVGVEYWSNHRRHHHHHRHRTYERSYVVERDFYRVRP